MMMAEDNVVELAEFIVDPTQEDDVAIIQVELVREMRRNWINNNGSQKDVGANLPTSKCQSKYREERYFPLRLSKTTVQNM